MYAESKEEERRRKHDMKKLVAEEGEVVEDGANKSKVAEMIAKME